MTALPTSAEASIFARWRDTRSPIDDGGDYFRRRELELAELRWGVPASAARGTACHQSMLRGADASQRAATSFRHCISWSSPAPNRRSRVAKSPRWGGLVLLLGL